MDTMLEIRPGRRIKVSVYKNSATKPTIFMIHGMGGRGAQWREQIKALGDDYTLIVPDLLGQGNSEKPLLQGNNPYSFAALTEDIQALFERFAGERNFVFGHSYGGAMSTFLAMQNQSRVQKLVLIAPVSCQPFKQVPLIYLLPVSLLEFLRKGLDRSFEKLAFVAEDDPALLEIERAARDANPMRVIKALLLGMRRIAAVDVAHLPIPTLIISGVHDQVIPLSWVKAFYQRLPHYQWHALDKASHMVHLERSVEVNRLLSQFCSS